jgi:Pericentrin-AKAP-450 domain of centrosomal targeting protein
MVSVSPIFMTLANEISNTSNIRMIEEMGISPDPKVRRKPSLKAAAQAIVFCSRLRKASQAWAEQRKMQDALVQKMESIRAHGGKRFAIRS